MFARESRRSSVFDVLALNLLVVLFVGNGVVLPVGGPSGSV